jgi:hypothetical protein
MDPLLPVQERGGPEAMKDLYLTMQIRNNLLRKRRVDRGMTGADLCRAIDIEPTVYSKLERMSLPPMHIPVLRVCRVPDCPNGANYPSRMLCRKHKELSDTSPFPFKRGSSTWRPEVVKLATFYNCEPAALFPADVLCVEKSTFEKEMDFSEIAALLPSPSSSMDPESLLRIEGTTRMCEEEVSRALSTLSPREDKVIKSRFGFDGEPKTLEAIGIEMGICRDRVRQIEAHALRKLRHPRCSKLLAKLVEP